MTEAAAMVGDANRQKIGTSNCNGMELESVRLGILAVARTLVWPRFQRRVTPEDVAQTALARVWMYRASFRGTTQAELFAFTCKTLRNVVIDEMKQMDTEPGAGCGVSSIEDLAHRSGVLINGLGGQSASTPSSRLMKEERRLAVLTALERLSPSQRDAVIFRYYHGLSIAEIAELLDRSLGAVSMLLQHGLRKLEERLVGKI